MNVPVRVSPRAQRSIDDITDDLLQRAGVQAATRFLMAMRVMRDRLTDMPESGGVVVAERGDGLRLQPVQRFRPYLLLSRFDGSEVQILDVFDGRRDHGMLRV